MESDQAKLFVGGISRETTENVLKEHFGKYGDVSSSLVAKDRSSGVPRGFGFVSFVDKSAAEIALQDTHVILGRTVEVKKAIPRSEQQPNQPQQQQQSRGLRDNGNCDGCCSVRTKKIFVGGLPPSVTEEEFKSYFERFGRITDGVVMHDSATHRPRGFGFITFDTEESVDSVMKTNFYDLNGRVVEVKRAVPKDSNAGYNMKDGGRGSNPTYSPMHGVIPCYAPFPAYNAVGGYFWGLNAYGCGYPMGGYGGFGYGMPMLAPACPWNGPWSVDFRGCLPNGNTYGHPASTNNSVRVLGNGNSVYNGAVGAGVNVKLGQVADGKRLVLDDVESPQVKGTTLGIDSSELNGSNGAASGEENQRVSNAHS